MDEDARNPARCGRKDPHDAHEATGEHGGLKYGARCPGVFLLTVLDGVKMPGTPDPLTGSGGERCSEAYPHDPHDVSADHNPAQAAFRCPGVVWHREPGKPRPVTVMYAPGTASEELLDSAPPGSISVRDLARETGTSVSYVHSLVQQIKPRDLYREPAVRVYVSKGPWPGDSVLTADCANAVREWDTKPVKVSPPVGSGPADVQKIIKAWKALVAAGVITGSGDGEESPGLREIAAEIIAADGAKDRAGFTVLGTEHIVNARVWSWALRTAGRTE